MNILKRSVALALAVFFMAGLSSGFAAVSGNKPGSLVPPYGEALQVQGAAKGLKVGGPVYVHLYNQLQCPVPEQLIDYFFVDGATCGSELNEVAITCVCVKACGAMNEDCQSACAAEISDFDIDDYLACSPNEGNYTAMEVVGRMDQSNKNSIALRGDYDLWEDSEGEPPYYDKTFSLANEKFTYDTILALIGDELVQYFFEDTTLCGVPSDDPRAFNPCATIYLKDVPETKFGQVSGEGEVFFMIDVELALDQ